MKSRNLSELEKLEMAKFFEKIEKTSAKAAEARAALPEPEVTFEVDTGTAGEDGNVSGAAVIVHVRYPLDYDDALAFKRKKSLIIGETSSPVPVQFKVEGEEEAQTLTLDGNPFRFAGTLSIYQEDKKAEETKASAEGATAEDNSANANASASADADDSGGKPEAV